MSVEDIKLKECPFCNSSGIGWVGLTVDICENDIQVFARCRSCGSRGETLGIMLQEMRDKSPSTIISLIEDHAESAADSWNWRKGESD